MQSQNGLPILGLALPHTLREKKRERKALWWKDRTQSPTCTPFLPPSFPCPVELIWQRGASISQFTLAAAFLVLCRLSVALPVSLPPYTSPHPPSLCIHLFTVFVCAQLLLCMQWWNNVMYSNMKDGPSPGAGNTCFIPAKVLPPSLVCPQLLCSLSLVHT